MRQKDIAYGLGAYALWGILPIYWKLMQNFHPMAILSLRIVHASIFLLVVLWVGKRLPEMAAAFRQKAVLIHILLAAFLITINWGIYIWAVNHAMIVESSLGYFINPLISVAFGILFFREKLTPVLWVCIGLAFIGIGIMTVSYGRIPWVSLILAFAFALYAVVKKRVAVDSVMSLAMETVVIAPFAILTLIGLTASGVVSTQPVDTLDIILSFLAGMITAIPLMLFGVAAKRLPLYVMGFLQYLAPTLQLLIGVFLYKETFTPTYLIAFSFIWCALLLFTSTQIMEARKRNIVKNLKE